MTLSGVDANQVVCGAFGDELACFTIIWPATGGDIGDIGTPGYDWKPLPNPVAGPLASICAIRRDLNGYPDHRGTGSLVTNRALITAAHVVDVGQSRKPYNGYWLFRSSRFYAIRAKNAGFSLGTEWVAHIAVPVQKPVLGSEADIAVLIMNGPASSDLVPLIPMPFNSNGAHHLAVAGYPKHWDPQIADGERILVGFGPGGINPAVEHELVYRIDTFAGQSGGPVLLESDQSYLVGIHVDEADAIHNAGLRLTEANLNWVARVIQDFTQGGG